MGPGGAVGGKTDYKKSRETVPLRYFLYIHILLLLSNQIHPIKIINNLQRQRYKENGRQRY